MPLTGSPPQLQTNVAVQINGVNLELEPFAGNLTKGLGIQVKADQSGVRVTLIEAPDHEGNTLRSHYQGTITLPDKAKFWSLELTQTSTIDLVFGIDRMRSVEFLATPRIIQGRVYRAGFTECERY